MSFITRIMMAIWEIFKNVLQILDIFKERKLEKIDQKEVVRKTKETTDRVVKEVEKGDLDELNKEVGWKG